MKKKGGEFPAIFFSVFGTSLALLLVLVFSRANYSYAQASNDPPPVDPPPTIPPPDLKKTQYLGTFDSGFQIEKFLDGPVSCYVLLAPDGVEKGISCT